MVVTNEQYFESVRMLRVCKEKEDYIEQSKSLPVWCGVDENELEKYLSIVYDAAHRDLNEVAKALGYSLRQLSLRLGFQYNTLCSWAKGNMSRSYAEFLLIQEYFGMVKIPHE